MAVVDGQDTGEGDRVLSLVWKRFEPNLVVLRRPAGVADSDLSEALRPLFEGKKSEGGRVSVYVCERGACQSPLVGADAFEAAWNLPA